MMTAKAVRRGNPVPTLALELALALALELPLENYENFCLLVASQFFKFVLKNRLVWVWEYYRIWDPRRLALA
jgi:hypothetical protein